MVVTNPDRLRLAHWKDAAGPVAEHVVVDADVFAADGAYFRTLGEGIVRWDDWFAALHASAVDPCILLELDAAPDPIASLIAARQHLTPIVTTPSTIRPRTN